MAGVSTADARGFGGAYGDGELGSISGVGSWCTVSAVSASRLPSDAAPVHEGESTGAGCADARRPSGGSCWLPPVILAALTLWLTIITAGSVHVCIGWPCGQAARMAREMAHHPHHHGKHRSLKGVAAGARRPLVPVESGMPVFLPLWGFFRSPAGADLS